MESYYSVKRPETPVKGMQWCYQCKRVQLLSAFDSGRSGCKKCLPKKRGKPQPVAPKVIPEGKKWCGAGRHLTEIGNFDADRLNCRRHLSMMKETHRKHPERKKAQNRKQMDYHRDVRLPKLKEAKGLICAADCGETRPNWFDFDHLHSRAEEKNGGPPAEMNGRISGNIGWSEKRMSAELDLTQLLCVVCHARKTIREGNRYKFLWMQPHEFERDPSLSREENRKRNNLKRVRRNHLVSINEKHRRAECVGCGIPVGDWNSRYPFFIFEWNHLKPKVKGIDREVAKLLHAGASTKRILEEIAKCDLRCIPCHRKNTSEQWRNGEITRNRVKGPRVF